MLFQSVSGSLAGCHAHIHYSGTSLQAWQAEFTSEAQPLRKEESLESGQACVNGDSHLLEASRVRVGVRPR